MEKLLNATEADYRSFPRLSFSQLFRQEQTPAHSFIREMKNGKHPKAAKGLLHNEIAQLVMSGQKDVVYLSTISLLKPDTDPIEMDGFEFEYKCKLDYVSGTTGAFIVATKATDGKQFVNACIKRNLYEKALLAMLCSDIHSCLLIGVSTTKQGRVFTSVMHNKSEKVSETMKNIRAAAYAKGHIQ